MKICRRLLWDDRISAKTDNVFELLSGKPLSGRAEESAKSGFKANGNSIAADSEQRKTCRTVVGRVKIAVHGFGESYKKPEVIRLPAFVISKNLFS